VRRILSRHCPAAFFLSLALHSFGAETMEPEAALSPAQSEPPRAITGNPAAVNDLAGTGTAGRLLHIPESLGIRLGGVWLADTNGLISGGDQPGKWSWNSALIVSLSVDAEKLINWPGASFGIQFLQFNGEPTNAQAGSVQGYNSLPGSDPLDRSELYQLWYRQSLFAERVIFRIGKLVPTYDFNNVARPVPTHDSELDIPAVTGLLYTPIFVNPTLLGAIGGYYNSVSGATVSVAPTQYTYLRYGFYDGNVARGVQTGLMGPQFNGYYFNIWEGGADWVLSERYPGQFGAGLWYQTGELGGPKGVSQNGTGGFYMFGGQRIWSNHAHKIPIDRGGSENGRRKTVAPADYGRQHASISAFFQFGVNNSETLPVNQYFGLGLTGFGLVARRPGDSIGVGLSWAWLNPNLFDRSSELMLQGYYQAQLIGATFLQPALTYIPTPGASRSLGGAWALTFRLTLLF
jgi:porin